MESLESEEFVQDHTLDFSDPLQRSVVPKEPHRLMHERRGDLNGIGRGKAIPGTELGRAIRHCNGDGNPRQARAGRGEREDPVSQVLLLLSIRLDQQFQQRDR